MVNVTTEIESLTESLNSLQSYANSVQSSVDENSTGADDLWVIVCAIFVFLMQAGFAMLEAGTVRSKNTVNILFKNLIDGAIAAITFWILGYGFAYGDTERGVIGASRFGLADSDFDIGDGSSQLQFHIFFFQWAFAATAATIVSGCVAERCKIEAYFMYSAWITMWIYPVVAHWGWGGGWLSPFATDTGDYLMYGRKSNSFIDFAGSGIVHMVGGICGLVAAIFLGPRKGRFDEIGKVLPMPGHSTPLVFLGTIILWVGWYGFNPGSTLCIVGDCAKLASKVAVVTTIAAASGALTMLAYLRWNEMPLDIGEVSNALLAGLVSITAPCAVVDNWAAMMIGCIGCLIYVFTSWQLLLLKIDDPLNASPVHGFCGAWGVLAVGIFGNDNNAAFAGYQGSAAGFHPFRTGEQFTVQLVGMLAIICWTAVNAIILFSVIHLLLGGMRVTAKREEDGLDKSEHGDISYSAVQSPTPAAAAAANYLDKSSDGGSDNIDHHNDDGPGGGGGGGLEDSRVHSESWVDVDEEDAQAYQNWDGQRAQSAAFEVGDIHSRGESQVFKEGDLKDALQQVRGTASGGGVVPTAGQASLDAADE